MDKFRMNATIYGNEIEGGFDMPEGLEKEDYALVFSNRFAKCLTAFSEAMEKALILGERK